MENKSKIAFSVVLPTYRVARFIERAIISLQNQSFKEFEMIFVDDCGEDGSIDIVSWYAETDSRIFIVKHEQNRGTFHARKSGVEYAKGRYIIFLDPDDELDENCLSKLYEHLSISPASVIFYGIKTVPAPPWYKSPMKSLPVRSKDSLLESMFKKTIGGYKFTTLGTPGKAYNRELLLTVYDELAIPSDFRYVFSEDSVLLLTCAMKNPSFCTINYNGYIYHRNPSSITHQRQLSSQSQYISDQIIFTMDILQKQIDRHHLTETEQAFFHFYIYHHTKSDLLLLNRFNSNGTHYFQSIVATFLTQPKFKHLVRMILFVLTIGRIRI